MGLTEYSTAAVTVLAEQIEGEPRAIITPNGAVTGAVGDWEVRYPDGNVVALTNEEFQEMFGKGKDSGTPDESAEETQNAQPGDQPDKEEEEASEHDSRPSPPPPARRRG